MNLILLHPFFCQLRLAGAGLLSLYKYDACTQVCYSFKEKKSAKYTQFIKKKIAVARSEEAVGQEASD